MKTCTLCNETKEPNQFSKNKRSSDGYQSRCKDCVKSYREQCKAKNLATDFSSFKELICNKCKKIKSIENFSSKPDNPRGFEYWCKDCVNASKRDNYKEDIDNKRKQTNARRAKRIAWLRTLKSNTPCLDCGKIFDPSCMDYDHVLERGKKIKAVSRMVLENCSVEEIMEEIAKCDLVCLLCHNRRTEQRFKEQSSGKQYRAGIARNIAIINDFKSKPCVYCNIQYDLCNMQIDHTNPITKLYDVCKLKSFRESILLDELAKCRVVCALCHRLKSLEEQKTGVYTSDRDVPNKRKTAKT